MVVTHFLTLSRGALLYDVTLLAITNYESISYCLNILTCFNLMNIRQFFIIDLCSNFYAANLLYMTIYLKLELADYYLAMLVHTCKYMVGVQYSDSSYCVAILCIYW